MQYATEESFALGLSCASPCGRVILCSLVVIEPSRHGCIVTANRRRVKAESYLLSSLVRNVPFLTSIEVSPFFLARRTRLLLVFSSFNPPEGGGKVGNLLLVFHFSTVASPELWECGNLAGFARFPRSGGKRGNPGFGFPRFPPLRHFHSSFVHRTVPLRARICR